MALFLHLPSPQLRHTAATLRPRFACSSNVPARDRVIGFGKHKGRMLGSLPSSYLQWVSKSLRARDFEEWASMADEVLRDPIYRDRLEWEAAERILTGNAHRRRSSVSAESPVSELHEVSERFGWDNKDRDAWARIDFELLGTSKGGRIPRVRTGGEERKGEIYRRDADLAKGLEKKSVVLGGNSSARVRKEAVVGGKATYSCDMRLQRVDASSKGKMGTASRDFTSGDLKDSVRREDSKGLSDGVKSVKLLSKGHRYVIGRERDDEEEKGRRMEAAAANRGNREERRERRRLKREQQLEMLRREVGTEEGIGRSKADALAKVGVSEGKQIANPFPGRNALLEKVQKSRR